MPASFRNATTQDYKVLQRKSYVSNVLDFDNLTGDKEYIIFLHFKVKTDTISPNVIINDDTTATNYNCQRGVYTTTANAARSNNNNLFANIAADDIGRAIIYISLSKIENNYLTLTCHALTGISTGTVTTRETNMTNSNVINNITRIRFSKDGLGDIIGNGILCEVLK